MKRHISTAFAALIVMGSFMPAFADDHGAKVGAPLSSYRVDTMGKNQHHVYTEILINASAAEVWQVLGDFKNMSNWSSTLQGMKGDIRDGGQVVVSYKFPDRIAEIAHTISYTKGVGFGWSDPLDFAPEMADKHRFVIEPISEHQSRFKQYDTFTGVGPKGSKITTELISQNVLSIYRIFNAELKAAVEVKFK